MTLLQIQYVMTCAELRSLTKAAKSLYTTTSNLSKTLHSLEEELGFEIFSRDSYGITPTDRGRSFMSHAYNILSECEQIAEMQPGRTHRKFSCACSQIPHCFDAFSELCRFYQDDDSLSLSLFTGYYSECVDRVVKRQCELGIISMPHLIDSAQHQILEHYRLTVEHLKRQTLNINLREGHPALDGYEPGRPFDMSVLQNYPYISYSNPEDKMEFPTDFSQYSYFALGAINTEKSIYVNNMDWKAQLVGQTDAFSIGITGPEELARKNHWVCIPLPDYESNMYAIYPERAALGKEAEKYLEILKRILSVLPV